MLCQELIYPSECFESNVGCRKSTQYRKTFVISSKVRLHCWRHVCLLTLLRSKGTQSCDHKFSMQSSSQQCVVDEICVRLSRREWSCLINDINEQWYITFPGQSIWGVINWGEQQLWHQLADGSVTYYSWEIKKRHITKNNIKKTNKLEDEEAEGVWCVAITVKSHSDIMQSDTFITRKWWYGIYAY